MSEPFFLESDCEQIKFKRGVFDYVVTTPDDIKYISLAKANALILERGVVVYGKPKMNERQWLTPLTENNVPIGSSHQALLINIEPIERDSAEKIVWDLAKIEWGSAFAELRDRARKLKGGV